ncbi:ATP-binding protein [Nonomuraea rhizosphaerae]|uniref:ATP-binding protein n=1 Tax=Nonomuraea rhizosphaerae TaxID=2665663 RepID=UPI001C5F831E|nr:ATP-binding protein [Nonomuraea rhizosphaerae]
MTALRRTVFEQAAACGLTGARLEDYVLAVHESVINAVEHGGGRGHFTLWTIDRMLRSETTDHGPGIPGGYVDGLRLPADSSFTGRGIYLIRRLCDNACFLTGTTGTTVQLTMWLPQPAHLSPTRAPMRRVRVTAGGGHERVDGFRA